MFHKLKKKSNKTLMATSELTSETVSNRNPLFKKITDFVYKYKQYIIIISIILLTIYATYYFSKSKTVNRKILLLEKAFNKKIFQKDYCHEELKYNKLCDYYVKSSSNSFLVGLRNFGHTSLDVMRNLLNFGVRYLEINIYSKTFKNDTAPVIAPGLNQGEWKLSLNTILVKDFFIMISQVAFSEKYLNNFRDPLFIFLDIRTKNKKTLDKVYDIILNTCSKNLLPSKYSSQKQNIGNATMCELMDKLILFSSDGYQDSKLETLINASTNQPSLKRITISELNKIVNRIDKDGIRKADFLVKTGYVEFKKGIQNDYIETSDPDINFEKFGINTNYEIKLEGSKFPQNNTGNKYLKVKYVKKDKIYFNRNDVFKPEKKGNEITITGFDLKHGDENLENRNKTDITIVTPDNGLLSNNYDVFKALTYGCQFVGIYYHTVDKYSKKYNDFFNNTGLKLKPQVLRRKINKPPESALNELFPSPSENLDLNIDYNFMVDYSEIQLTPYLNMDLALVNDKNIARISPTHRPNNSNLVIEQGLSGKEYSVSFKIGNKYLVNSDKCCYLFFVERPGENNREGRIQFDHDASFYPTAPLCSIEGYHSFIISKDKDYNIEKDDEKIPNYESLYYLRYKTNFNPNTKLYKYYTSFYIKILTLTDGTEPITIWRPTIRDRYHPIGDIAVPGINMPKFKTTIIGGAVAKPIDYTLVYDNKLVNQSYRLSIWKPVPPDGYIAMGYVFNTSFDKPSFDEIMCVASEYLTPKSVNETALWKNTTQEQKTDGFMYGSALSFWKVEGSDYVIVSNSLFKPNEFDTPGFTINFNEKDFTDRLYLERFTSDDKDKESACFKVVNLRKKTEKASDNAKEIVGAERQIKDFKIISKRASDEGNNVCVSLKTPYWTPFYRDIEADAKSEYGNIKGAINNNTFIAEITNSRLNLNDYIYINYEKTSGKYVNYMNGKVFQVLEASDNINNTVNIKFSEGIRDTTMFETIDIDEKVYQKRKRWVKVFNYVDSEQKKGLHVQNCKDVNYAGTNWTYYGDNTIRLSKNTKYCMNNDSDTSNINIKECDNSFNQKFSIGPMITSLQDEKKGEHIRKMNVNDTLGNCLAYDEDSILSLRECENNNIRQKWFIKKTNDTLCLSIGKQINMLVYEPRAPKNDNMSSNGIYLDERIKETYDFSNFHLYVRGEIVGERGDKFLVNLYNNLNKSLEERKYAYKNTDKIVSDDIPNHESLKRGIEVICRNGELNKQGYSEDYVKWKGIITKKIDNDTYNVLFSINSVELDSTRDSLGRKRYLQEKRVKRYDIRLLKKFPVCERIKKQTFNDERVCNLEKLEKELYQLKRTQDDIIQAGIDSQRYTYSMNQQECRIDSEPEVDSCDNEQPDMGLFSFFNKPHAYPDVNLENNNEIKKVIEEYDKVIYEINQFEKKLRTMNQTQIQNLKYNIDNIKKTYTVNQFNAIKLKAEEKIINGVYNHMINITTNFYEIYKYIFN